MTGVQTCALPILRERLREIIGPDAYKVAIHTFHSFGSEVIGHYPQYFYQGADFRPADELRDRKSVVEGKSVSVRVDLGGRRILKNKTNTEQMNEKKR